MGTGKKKLTKPPPQSEYPAYSAPPPPPLFVLTHPLVRARSAFAHDQEQGKGASVPRRPTHAPASNAPPQPIPDPSENGQQLTEQLRALGLYAAPTLGDGNCLFRALSDQLFGSPAHHLALRQDICGWIEGHRARYEPFCDDERGFDVHLGCMRQQGQSRSLAPIYHRPESNCATT